MKISKKIAILGLSVLMFQTISFADDQIPSHVFTDLSVVIDSVTDIEGEVPVLPEEITSSLEEKITYTRDRNNSKLLVNMAGLENSAVAEETASIRIELSEDVMTQNNLFAPITYSVDKNDRLVQSIYYENVDNRNYINITLKDNVDYYTSVTSSGVEINFEKRTPSIPKIVIDPGHGGKDPGTYSQTTKTQEKAVALRTGLLLRDILLSKGYDVTMTRDSDWYPELRDRSALANEMDADVFISIHYNSATSSASGIETFAYYTDDNKALADSIQKELISYTGATNRGVKNGNKLIVLNTTKVPAVLVELGFMSNPTEAKRLLEDDYQNALAQAMASGIDIYFGR